MTRLRVTTTTTTFSLLFFFFLFFLLSSLFSICTSTFYQYKKKIPLSVSESVYLPFCPVTVLRYKNSRLCVHGHFQCPFVLTLKSQRRCQCVFMLYMYNGKNIPLPSSYFFFSSDIVNMKLYLSTKAQRTINS